jgi:Domain of unknown function (DUF4328)
MNDNNNVLQGLKHNTYYFYSICAVSAIGIFNNIINYQYVDELKGITNNIVKTLSDQGKDATNFQSILTETATQTAYLTDKFKTQLLISQFLSFISLVFLIAAITFLAKTVLNYYGEFSRSKEGKTLVTPSGAAWGWFIPFLNFVRPFNTTNEVLNGETTPTKDPQVATAQYAIWAAFALGLINGLFSSVTPTALTILLSAVTSLLGLYATYNMFNVHKRIFEMQK